MLDPLKLELMDGCELPCGCWEPNLGPLQEQQVLITAESTLQPQGIQTLEVKILLQVYPSWSRASSLNKQFRSDLELSAPRAS